MDIEKDAIFKMVERNWPMHVSEIVYNFQSADSAANPDLVHQAVLYCLNELGNENKIILKDLGGTKVVLPAEIKRLREPEDAGPE